jgi:hypothetical protein
MLLVCLVNGVSAAAALRRRGAGLAPALRARAGLWTVLVVTVCAYGTTAVVHGPEAVGAATWSGTAGTRVAGVQTGTEAATAILAAAATAVPSTGSADPRKNEDRPSWSSAVQPTSAQPELAPAPAVAPTPTPRPLGLPSDRLTLGAYDPWESFVDLPLGLEHWYVRQDRADLLAGALARARDRRTLLVTVEPFPPAGSHDDVLETVSSGRADEELRRLARVARAARPQMLLLRWGHEMELNDLYPWSARAPGTYRAAYRRVVELFRREGATNVQWVWSPAGNPEASPYYPGDDVVDYVGLTVLGDARWDATFGLPPQSFADLLAPKYALAAGHAKPVLIAELGVSGTPDRQREWLLAAAAALGEYPRVRAISYFGDVNSPNNRLSEQPDWRVAAPSYGAFVRAVAEADLARLGRIAPNNDPDRPS